MNANIDTRSAFCDKCHAAIRQYDTDGGLWLTDCLGGRYNCGAGGLHVAPAHGVQDARNAYWRFTDANPDATPLAATDYIQELEGALHNAVKS